MVVVLIYSTKPLHDPGQQLFTACHGQWSQRPQRPAHAALHAMMPHEPSQLTALRARIDRVIQLVHAQRYVAHSCPCTTPYTKLDPRIRHINCQLYRSHC